MGGCAFVSFTRGGLGGGVRCTHSLGSLKEHVQASCMFSFSACMTEGLLALQLSYHRLVLFIKPAPSFLLLV